MSRVAWDPTGSTDRLAAVGDDRWEVGGVGGGRGGRAGGRQWWGGRCAPTPPRPAPPPTPFCPASPPRPLRIWDGRAGLVKAALPTPVPEGSFNISLAWNPGPSSSSVVAVGNDADGVAFIDVAAGVTLRSAPRPGHEVNEVGWSADGKLFFQARGGGGGVPGE